MHAFLSLLCGLVLAVPVFASSPLSLQVRPLNENKTPSAKATEKVHNHWLVVRVTSSAGMKLEGLTLRWKLYAADLQRGADEIRVEKSGDGKFSVDAGGHFTDVTTPQVPFAWTPQHAVRSGSSRRPVFKTVPETGHRYHGYWVQVLEGDTVVAEAISSEALRKLQ